MKKNFSIFLLSIALFYALSSCSDSRNNAVVVFAPIIGIEYTDKGGSNLIKGLPLSNSSYEVDKSIFEILSIIDENGNSVEYGKVCIGSDKRPVIGFSLRETYSLASPAIKREYTLKYKIPPILGEGVVEVKLIYKVEGMNSGFTNTWYNNEECKPIFGKSQTISPDATDADIEAFESTMNEALYCGDIVSYMEDDLVMLVIPIEM